MLVFYNLELKRGNYCSILIYYPSNLKFWNIAEENICSKMIIVKNL